jgi:sulfide:quinone oxidoreductase
VQDTAQEAERVHHAIVIVGGGAAGISVAAMLRRRRRRVSIAVIEPSPTHGLQAGWPLVGAGRLSPERTVRPEADVMPPGVTWIRAAAMRLLPDQNTVVLDDGRRIVYGFLVACPGVVVRWDRIEGLGDTLGRNGVCSVFSAEGAAYTWNCIRHFVGGAALFTQPSPSMARADASQGILYLAADHWRRNGRLEHSRLEFCLAGQALFEAPFFVPALQGIADEYGVAAHYREELTAIDGRQRTATFQTLDPDGTPRLVRRKFDMIHVAPAVEPPDIIRNSRLADPAGWIAVDPVTLRHVRYVNVFGLGDAIGTANAKTLAAVRMQVPVVARNLLALLDGKRMRAQYDGYGACPIATSLGRVMLAEFNYEGAVTPSLRLDPRVPRRAAWREATRLPRLYWDKMLRGKRPTLWNRRRKPVETG